jgi:hypothetical protein
MPMYYKPGSLSEALGLPNPRAPMLSKDFLKKLITTRNNAVNAGDTIALQDAVDRLDQVRRRERAQHAAVASPELAELGTIVRGPVAGHVRYSAHARVVPQI